MKTLNVKVYEHLCKRCGKTWQSLSSNPLRCGKCKTSYWQRERNTTLKVICMDCKKPMGEKPGQGVSGDSHDLCPECWEKRFPGEAYPVEE